MTDQHLPSSFSEARAIGSRRYFTGKPCKYGHVAHRYAANGLCSVCLRIARDAVRVTPSGKAADAKRQRRFAKTAHGRSARRAYRRRLHVKLAERIRTRLWKAIKDRVKLGSAVGLLGCDIEELRAHLERQFLPGMSWNNYGQNGWHIDHIFPLAKADLTDAAELARVCHFTNLQPLWQADNISKGDRV